MLEMTLNPPHHQHTLFYRITQSEKGSLCPSCALTMPGLPSLSTQQAPSRDCFPDPSAARRGERQCWVDAWTLYSHIPPGKRRGVECRAQESDRAHSARPAEEGLGGVAESPIPDFPRAKSNEVWKDLVCSAEQIASLSRFRLTRLAQSASLLLSGWPSPNAALGATGRPARIPWSLEVWKTRRVKWLPPSP